MKPWIERHEQFYGTLSWGGVSTLFREVNCALYTNLTQMEIDLENGFKDKHSSMHFHSAIFLLSYFINVNADVFFFK